MHNAPATCAHRAHLALFLQDSINVSLHNFETSKDTLRLPVFFFHCSTRQPSIPNLAVIRDSTKDLSAFFSHDHKCSPHRTPQSGLLCMPNTNNLFIFFVDFTSTHYLKACRLTTYFHYSPAIFNPTELCMCPASSHPLRCLSSNAQQNISSLHDAFQLLLQSVCVAQKMSLAIYTSILAA